MTIALLFLFLLICMLAGVPIGLALVASSIAYLLGMTTIPITVIAQRMFTGIDSFPLMAIPFFVVSGVLMEAGGSSKKLIDVSNAFFGHITGGLAVATIITSAFFAAISGSSAATVAAIGSIMIPAMIREGYDRPFAASTQACCGQLGLIIPPSIAMILFGVSTNTSISSLFLAGFLPGIFMVGALCLMAYKISEKRGYLGGKKYTAKERWIAFKNSFWAILMPIIVLGAIYSGICTPTESSAIAVAYSFILGKFIYRELTLSKIVDVFADAAISTANILCLISCAVAFAWVLGRLNVPVQVASYITELAESKVVFILLVNIMLFIVGMFMDPAPAILILSPILCPIAAFWGIDMIHFGIIMVMNLAVGCCTPPVGINLFLSCQIAETSFVSVAKDALPYLILLLIVVLVISYVPWLSLVLL